MLKGTALFEALTRGLRSGAVHGGVGCRRDALCDPMVDPRGGAYTVGLGIVPNLAVFPYHGRAADHLRERSIELLPADAVLVGLDEETALVRDPRASGASTRLATRPSTAWRHTAVLAVSATCLERGVTVRYLSVIVHLVDVDRAPGSAPSPLPESGANHSIFCATSRDPTVTVPNFGDLGPRC